MIFSVRFVPSLRVAGTGASLGLFAGMTLLFFIAILLQVLSAAGVRFLTVSGAYLAGLTCVLIVAGVSLVRLVTAPRDTD